MEHKIRIHDRVREIYERTRAFEPHPARTGAEESAGHSKSKIAGHRG